jgi:enterochelin esterase-like enzyme
MPRWNSFETFLNDVEHARNDGERQTFADELVTEHEWPWIEGNKATFIFASLGARKNVALNLDTIKEDPPFAPMTNLKGTTLWYVRRDFAPDDLLDYLIAVDDPLTPLASEPNIVERVARYWRPDPANPLKMETNQQEVSVLRMTNARPFLDWSSLKAVQHGKIREHSFDSIQLSFKGRKLWVYTPPGYDRSGLAYPLLILQDGQWMNGPLQVPAIADTLIKHGRLAPVIIAMVQSGSQPERAREYTSNDRHYASLLLEVLPLVQTQYRIDSTNLGVGGVAIGAIAAAHAALKNPAVFNSLLMISPPLDKGPDEALLKQYAPRFELSPMLPRRIFQSVGRYEARGRFLRPAQTLRDILQGRERVAYRFVNIGSGHGLVGFRSVMPEALSWIFPGSGDSSE